MPRQRGPGHLGPFGNACMNCSKAKCKCVARPDGPGCQRCHRLKKTCQPSDSTKPGALRSRDTERIAQLEAKLDGLISRLEGTPRTKKPPAVSIPKNKGQSSRAMAEDEDKDEDMDEEGSDDHSNEENADDSDSGEDDDAEDDYDRMRPSPPIRDDEVGTVENETEVFGVFRSHMLPHFPFFSLDDRYYVPGGAHQLAGERPFLWRAILSVASPRGRITKGVELRHSLCKALLCEDSEADQMDLLLGLLTYLSWGWDHNKHISRLTLQAISLACEMMPSANPEPARGFDARSLRLPDADGTAGNTTTGGFLERNRAVLGCFVLSSAVAAFLDHSIDALRWTPQLAEGLAVLDANVRECASDSTLAAQVRLQLLSQKAANIRRQQLGQAHVQASTSAGSDGGTNDHLVTLATLQADTEALALRPPAPSVLHVVEAASRSRHLAHVSATELAIGATRYQILAAQPFIMDHFSALNSNTAGRPTRGERARCLWACVDAAQGCAANLLSLADADFAGVSLVQWAQLVRGLTLLHFVTVACQDPYPFWDRAAARAVVDVPALVDRVADKVVAAAAVTGEQLGPVGLESEGSLAGIAWRLRSFGAQVREVMAREGAEGTGEGMNANGQPGAALPWIHGSGASRTWRMSP